MKLSPASAILLLLLGLASLCCSQEQKQASNSVYGYPETARKKLNLNQDWRFHLGDPDATFFEAETSDATWENVHVPHTLCLTSLALDGLEDEKTQLIFHREVAWYRKKMTSALSSATKFS